MHYCNLIDLRRFRGVHDSGDRDYVAVEAPKGVAVRLSQTYCGEILHICGRDLVDR